MLSKRTAWTTTENALSARARAPGAVRWDLTRTNPTELGLSPRLGPALGLPGADRYVPDPRGSLEARRAVAEHHAPHAEVDADRVVLTASTSEAYAHLFHVLADPGDEVLVPAPGYPLFSFLADLAGVRLVSYPLAYDGAWHVDLPELERRVTERTRAIVLVSPNNPTGSYTKRDELTRIAALAASREIAVVSDEVFYDHPLGERPCGPSAATIREGLAITLSGLSKVVALPQAKVGWMIVTGGEREVSACMERLEIVADTFLSVSTPAQVALPSLLARGPEVRARIAARTRDGLARARAALSGTAASLLHVEGGWAAMVRLPATESEDAWALALLDRGVLVQPGHFYDASFGPLVVLSLLTPAPDLDAGLAALVALVG